MHSSEEIQVIESTNTHSNNAIQLNATLLTVHLSLMRLKRKLPAGIVSGWRPKTVSPGGWSDLYFM
jgi:hypothetical protein